jgi:hypothetical protein
MSKQGKNGKKKGGWTRPTLLRKQNMPLQINLHMQGFNDEEVAAKITQMNLAAGHGERGEVTATMVRRDRRENSKSWTSQMLWSINELRVSQAFKMERIFREAMAAWEESKKRSKRITLTGEVNENKAADAAKKPQLQTVSEQTQYGDPRFLMEARMALGEINRLFGAYADAPVEGATASDGRQRMSIAFIVNTEKSIKQLTNFKVIDVAPDEEETPKLGSRTTNGEHDDNGEFPSGNGENEG